jgi:hypothetical protein
MIIQLQFSEIMGCANLFRRFLTLAVYCISTPSILLTVFQLDQNRGALRPAPKNLHPSALFSHPLCPSALSTLPCAPLPFSCRT